MDRSMDEGLSRMAELLDVVHTLRGPGGCEWDRSQTIESLRPFLLEEAYEVAEAAAEGDWDALRVELGDLLLHIVMSSDIAREAGRFDLGQVAGGITAKLRRRHPHVFAEPSPLTPGEVEKQWEAIKATEKRGEGFFGSIPAGMPALQTAWRIQQRASEVGFDWPDASGALEKLEEEIEECREASAVGNREELAEELGDLLFSAVNYIRLLGYEPELLMRRASRKFITRFSAMESILRDGMVPLGEATAVQMDSAWRQARDMIEGDRVSNVRDD
jgi:MazG family protein